MLLSLHRCWTSRGKFEQLFLERTQAPLLIAFLHRVGSSFFEVSPDCSFSLHLDLEKAVYNDAAVGKHWKHLWKNDGCLVPCECRVLWIDILIHVNRWLYESFLTCPFPNVSTSTQRLAGGLGTSQPEGTLVMWTAEFCVCGVQRLWQRSILWITSSK